MPVLVDGDEVINDSRRIREYLDWRYGESNGGSGRFRVAQRGSTIGGDD